MLDVHQFGHLKVFAGVKDLHFSGFPLFLSHFFLFLFVVFMLMLELFIPPDYFCIVFNPIAWFCCPVGGFHLHDLLDYLILSVFLELLQIIERVTFRRRIFIVFKIHINQYKTLLIESKTKSSSSEFQQKRELGSSLRQTRIGSQNKINQMLREDVKYSLQNSEAPVKEVVYENRVLHIRKKFTLPPQVPSLEKKTLSLLERSQQPAFFSKFIDNVISNRHLCRRGPFDLPLPLYPPQHRPQRLKTDTGLTRQEVFLKRRLKSERSTTDGGKKLGWAKLKEVEERVKKQLPTLESARYQMEETVPIKVKKFVSKSVTRGYCLSPEEKRKLDKNIMLRKLNVELINYELQGKLATTRTGI